MAAAVVATAPMPRAARVVTMLRDPLIASFSGSVKSSHLYRRNIVPPEARRGTLDGYRPGGWGGFMVVADSGKVNFATCVLLPVLENFGQNTREVKTSLRALPDPTSRCLKLYLYSYLHQFKYVFARYCTAAPTSSDCILQIKCVWAILCFFN
jgi:hypothetical protein